MALTEQEQFEFDLNGFLVRPAILSPDEVAAIREQVRLLAEDPQSLPAEHRAACSGPSEILIDHPRVVDVLQETIGPDLRLEGGFHVYRHKGQGGQLIHHGADGGNSEVIYSYKVAQNRIFTGSIRVVFELTDVEEGDGGTAFLPGSHKTNFTKPRPWYGTPEEGNVAHLMRSYSCPAGSAVFFTEALAHAGSRWTRETPRIAILNLYSHVAINHTRWPVQPKVLNALPRERQAWYRPVWYGDFTSRPGQVVLNDLDTWVSGSEAPLSYPMLDEVTAGV